MFCISIHLDVLSNWCTRGASHAPMFGFIRSCLTNSGRPKTIMPRTKSSKQPDDKPPAERLQYIRSKIDLYIFFQYYDGYSTEGLVGFDPKHPPGSTKHKNLSKIFDHLTPAQFRGKGQKLVKLVKVFIDKKAVPSPELRPHFDSQTSIEELLLEIAGATKKDTRTPEEKLAEVTTLVDRFIFFTYYDGLSTNGLIGFSPRSGPPGSVNHKRAYQVLHQVTPADFRLKGKAMAGIAQEFIDKGISPSEDLRPDVVDTAPVGLLGAAAEAGY
jgi:hypothetical protein